MFMAQMAGGTLLISGVFFNDTSIKVTFLFFFVLFSSGTLFVMSTLHQTQKCIPSFSSYCLFPAYYKVLLYLKMCFPESHIFN